MEGLGNSLLMQTHWLTSQSLPTILSEWQETPPTPGPWDSLPLLGWLSCSQESQGPGEHESGSASPSPPWKQIQSLHPPLRAGRLHRPLQRAWRGASSIGGARSPAAQAGQQGAVLSGASKHGHSPWPRTPGRSLPGSRPTASLAAPEMLTPLSQCTPAPQPSPRGGGEIASTPRSEAQKGTRALRSSAARIAIHQRSVAAARL